MLSSNPFRKKKYKHVMLLFDTEGTFDVKSHAFSCSELHIHNGNVVFCSFYWGLVHGDPLFDGQLLCHDAQCVAFLQRWIARVLYGTLLLF